jgi:hypothetical protein
MPGRRVVPALYSRHDLLFSVENTWEFEDLAGFIRVLFLVAWVCIRGMSENPSQ